MFYAFNIKNIKKIANVILIFAIFGVFARFIVLPNILFPQKYLEYVDKFSEKYNIEPSLVYAVMLTESHFVPDALSRKGAKGLMQISDLTGEWAAEEIGIMGYTNDSLYNPEVNIEIGCWYLNKLIVQFNEPLETALAAYNAGSGNVSKWLANNQYSDDGKTLKQIPFKETRNYIKKVLTAKKIYELLYYEQ